MGFTREYDWDGDEKGAAMVFLGANLRIRLTDGERKPIPGGRCRTFGKRDVVYTCDSDGVVEIPIEDRSRRIVELEWEGPGGSGDFPWSNAFETGICSAQDGDCGIRLTHLGFTGAEMAGQVSGFQAFLGRQATGSMNDIRTDLVRWHDGGNRPGAAASAPSASQAPASTEVKSLVQKLYAAFNDSGFLGMGGTDEDGVLATLRRAKDKGLMREVDAQYRATFPDELSLKEELDDELSGDEFDSAMQLYNEGMQAKPQPASDTGSGGRTVSLNGTLAPGYLTSVRVQLLDADLKPMPEGRCRLAGSPDQVFNADGNGMVELPVHDGVSCVEIEWEDGDAAPDEGSDLPRFYYRSAVPLKDTGKAAA